MAVVAGVVVVDDDVVGLVVVAFKLPLGFVGVTVDRLLSVVLIAVSDVDFDAALVVFGDKSLDFR